MCDRIPDADGSIAGSACRAICCLRRVPVIMIVMSRFARQKEREKESLAAPPRFIPGAPDATKAAHRTRRVNMASKGGENHSMFFV